MNRDECEERTKPDPCRENTNNVSINSYCCRTLSTKLRRRTRTQSWRAMRRFRDVSMNIINKLLLEFGGLDSIGFAYFEFIAQAGCHIPQLKQAILLAAFCETDLHYAVCLNWILMCVYIQCTDMVFSSIAAPIEQPKCENINHNMMQNSIFANCVIRTHSDTHNEHAMRCNNSCNKEEMCAYGVSYIQPAKNSDNCEQSNRPSPLFNPIRSI